MSLQKLVSDFRPALALLLAAGAASVSAQTIGDYSAAQGAKPRSEMEQAAKPAQAASAPTPLVQAPVATGRGPQGTAMPQVSTPTEPFMTVTGASELRGRRTAEVLVNGGAYLLEAGEHVPGTDWIVQSIELRKVTLARSGGRSATGQGPTSKNGAGSAKSVGHAKVASKSSAATGATKPTSTRVFEFASVEKGA